MGMCWDALLSRGARSLPRVTVTKSLPEGGANSMFSFRFFRGMGGGRERRGKLRAGTHTYDPYLLALQPSLCSIYFPSCPVQSEGSGQIYCRACCTLSYVLYSRETLRDKRNPPPSGPILSPSISNGLQPRSTLNYDYDRPPLNTIQAALLLDSATLAPPTWCKSPRPHTLVRPRPPNALFP